MPIDEIDETRPIPLYLAIWKQGQSHVMAVTRIIPKDWEAVEVTTVLKEDDRVMIIIKKRR